jgi:hypothetical protein
MKHVMHSVNFTQLWISTCALKCSTLMCFHFNMWFEKEGQFLQAKL